MIGVVDSGIANLGSVANMLTRLGADHVVSSHAPTIARADALILPGVGAFDRGMEALDAAGLTPMLHERVLGDGVPMLGICLGMQLLARRSEEGERPGLGWLEADVVRLEANPAAGVMVPHMGWNVAVPTRRSKLFPDPAERPRFYFVHSYQVRCDDTADVAATAVHGSTFTAAVERGNVLGVQFHPEKSHRFGLELFQRFALGKLP